MQRKSEWFREAVIGPANREWLKTIFGIAIRREFEGVGQREAILDGITTEDTDNRT